jgi:hypothetical protein
MRRLQNTAKKNAQFPPVICSTERLSLGRNCLAGNPRPACRARTLLQDRAATDQNSESGIRLSRCHLERSNPRLLRLAESKDLRLFFGRLTKSMRQINSSNVWVHYPRCVFVLAVIDPALK